MSRVSPTLEGFRTAFRRPSFTLAEITWRWVIGASTIALFFLGLIEYLDTLPVTNSDLFLLRTREPYFVAQAIRHILRGSANRIVVAFCLAALLVSILWVVAASFGRVATVNALLDYARQRLARESWAAGLVQNDWTDLARNSSARNPLYAVLRLNFLRVALTLAAVTGLAGAAILAGFASPDANPRPALWVLLLVTLAGMIWLSWSSLNWLLSLATMFAVRDGDDALGAISAAAALCRDRPAAVVAVSSCAGVAHLVVFAGGSTLATVPMGLTAVLPWRLVALGTILAALAYCAVVDWLYMARLAGYVYVAETPDALLAPLPPMIVPPSEGPAVISHPPVQTTIDRDEPILSDVPDLSAEPSVRA